MKFSRIFSFILVFPFSLIIFAQETIMLNWSEHKYDKPISFENAVYLPRYEGLPAFEKVIKIDNNTFHNFELSDIEFIDVSTEEKEQLESFYFNQEAEYFSDILRSSSNFYNRILVFPYIKNGTSYKKMRKFTYKQTTIKSSPKTKSRSLKINSVLNENNWHKISVTKEGVHSLSFTDLTALGINTNSLSVSSIRLYGNGGGMIPRLNADLRHDDLVENAIHVIDNNNNFIFDNGDLILFYAESSDNWEYDNTLQKFVHHKNLFDDKNYYFITIDNDGNPKRINDGTSYPNFDVIYSTFDDYQFHEEDLVNFIQSGSEWYGEEFDASLTNTFSFSFPYLVNSSDVSIRASVAARAFNPPSFSFSYNGSPILDIPLGVILNGHDNDYVDIATSESVFYSNSSNIDIKVDFNRSSSLYKGWLNYIELNAVRSLNMHGDQMRFRNKDFQNYDFAKYILSNTSNSTKVWNVTDPTNVYSMNVINNGSSLEFIEQTDQIHEFIAFDGDEYFKPSLEGDVANQNLHGETDFEMLIICHDNFLTAANDLSNFHFQEEGKICKVVTPQQIYNEFSSGRQDVSAIRDYVRYLYNLPNSTFKYLLLFGDASYDPKNRIPNNTNYVLSYQSDNSYSPLNSFATDDYFGYLDDNEGLLLNDLVDIGIGRLPSKTLEEADNMVNKIIHYHDKLSRGDWRNRTCFIADDGDLNDGNIHMSQSESLSNIINDNYKRYNIHKIYLDAYDQESTPVGPRSETAEEAINQMIRKGALLINYTGHGGEPALAVERIIDSDQILEWNNYDNLPLFVTATCEFGRFDNPERTSGGELIILNKDGGGIALLTTTRYVYSHLNYSLNTNFINTLFEKVDGQYQTLGEVFLETKALSGTSINSTKFTLLGDPMMSLAHPKNNILTTIFPDTVAALGRVTFHGAVIDIDSTPISEFDGTLYVTVFDKEIISETQGQQSSTPMPYKKQNSIIYKGKASVKDGEFSFSFITPKDIDYVLGFGRLSYYAVAENDNIDASGWNESFIVGGMSSDITADEMGPGIQLYMNDKQFVSGGLTNPSPTFLAFVQDSSGINTVGNGIGHDITMTIDGESSKKINLNEYYEADIDSYQSGKVEYVLSDLSEGLHTIDFKVWDVFNNSSEASIEFFVSESEDFIVEHLLNYPNPFTTNTSFYFEHNRPNQPLEVQIQIFTVSGKLVKTINSLENNYGFRVGPIYWNGKDDFQDNIGRGSYIYKLRVKDENGEFVEKLEKLVILK